MAKTIFRIILVILLCLTFYEIFQFSNENSVKSSSRSRQVIKNIVDIFPYTKNLSEETKIKIVNNLQPIIRKLAHFSIYTLVGVLIMAFVSTYKLLLWKKFSISIIVGLIYAISDEYHQSFVPGRSAEIRDVLIDTTGVIFGIIIIIVIISVYKALSKKYINNQTKLSEEIK